MFINLYIYLYTYLQDRYEKRFSRGNCFFLVLVDIDISTYSFIIHSARKSFVIFSKKVLSIILDLITRLMFRCLQCALLYAQLLLFAI